MSVPSAVDRHHTMPFFPSQGALRQCLAPASPFYSPQVQSKEPERSPQTAFQTWSAVDDVKSKASELGAEAQAEYAKASAAAQAKSGKIELYSGKYYAACTVGGILACVSDNEMGSKRAEAQCHLGCYSYCCDAARPGKMSTTSRSEDVQGQFRSLGQDI